MNGCLTDRLAAFVPNMRKDNRLPIRPEGLYRIKNWPEYNAGLIQRGDVSIWMDEKMFVSAPVTSSQRGRAQTYCDGAMQMLLALKSVYRLPLRALQGFAQSLRRLAMPSLPVPNYSTLSRRAKALQVTLPALRNVGEAVHLLVDSTGLKLFGEGEWKVRKHRYAKRRSWRKVHATANWCGAPGLIFCRVFIPSNTSFEFSNTQQRSTYLLTKLAHRHRESMLAMPVVPDKLSIRPRTIKINAEE